MERVEILITKDGVKPTTGKFSGPVLNSGNYKIYIVVFGNVIQYVGKTNQKIGAKLQEGFRIFKSVENGGKKPSGYSGYKWIKKHMNNDSPLILFVEDLDTEDNDYTEAIEAEIAYLVREKTGRWPECQNEIHFHNDITNAKEKAKSILLKVQTNDR